MKMSNMHHQQQASYRSNNDDDDVEMIHIPPSGVEKMITTPIYRVTIGLHYVINCDYNCMFCI